MEDISRQLATLWLLLHLQGLKTRRINFKHHERFVFLARLHYAGGKLEQTQCGDFLQLSLQQTQLLTEHCEIHGLIKRSKGDRRSVKIVQLTPKGLREFEAELEKQIKHLKNSSDLFELKIPQGAVDLLRKLAESLKDRAKA